MSKCSVEVATNVDDELVAAFEDLIPQLSRSSLPPTRAELVEILDAGATTIFLARLDGRVVGSLTLVMFRIPTGLRAWIEDVVVADTARGHGVGLALNTAAIEHANNAGVRSIDLTSRPSREAANRLYKRIGFEERATTVYRYSHD